MRTVKDGGVRYGDAVWLRLGNVCISKIRTRLGTGNYMWGCWHEGELDKEVHGS